MAEVEIPVEVQEGAGLGVQGGGEDQGAGIREGDEALVEEAVVAGLQGGSRCRGPGVRRERMRPRVWRGWPPGAP